MGQIDNWQVIIDSANGLIPSGNKPLAETMLTNINVDIWLDYTTVSWYQIVITSQLMTRQFPISQLNLSRLILLINWGLVTHINLRKTGQFRKSQNAPVPYPTMLYSEQKCAHFCSEWSIVGYAHFCSEWINVGYETGAFWDWWIRSIVHHCVRLCLLPFHYQPLPKLPLYYWQFGPYKL